MKVYNLSKSARDELIENLSKVSQGLTVKYRDLKIAESDDPNYSVIFDEHEKLYLGKRKDPPTCFPLLKDETWLPGRPTITVDTGAIKFVCNGANVMRPGIVKIEGDFQPQDIVVIKEQKYGKAIAVGLAMLPKKEMEIATKGPVVTNIHYVGDKFWEMLKEIHT